MFNHDELKSIYVILPAFNEHKSIVKVVDDLSAAGYSLIVIDDASSPSLQPLLQNKKLLYARHKVNLGQGAALQTGIDLALKHGAKYIVSFDADGQHDIGDISRLYQYLQKEQLDIVLGSRFMEQQPKNISSNRKIVLRLARFVNLIFTGLLLTDAHNGLRVMTRDAAGKMRITENRMSHATEILSIIKKEKLRYSEQPVTIHYTDYSKSKGQSSWNSFRILFDLLLSKIFR